MEIAQFSREWLLRTVSASIRREMPPGMKFAATRLMVQLFDAIGVGRGFRIVTGLCELVT